MVRCFVAAWPPERVLAELSDAQEGLRASESFAGSFVPKDQLHVTVKFLGDLEEEDVADAIARLSAARLPNATAVVDGAGVFSEHDIRVVWARVEGLDALNGAVEDACAGLAEPSDFHGHITLARPKKVRDAERLLETVRSLDISGDFRTGGVSLVQSTLTPNGPVFQRLAEFSTVDAAAA